MMSIALIFLSAVLFQSAFSAPFGSTDSCTSGGDPQFDYYMLVQQYPKAVCFAKLFSDCTIPATSKLWTLHGLWPTLANSMNPNFCGTTETLFDVTALESIRDSLEVSWPSSRAGQNEIFWSHEWCKHGTCAKNVPEFDSEFKFFSGVMNLYNVHNYGDILTKNNIVPSNTTTYKLDSLDSAFQQVLGVKPFIECSYLKDTKQQVLFQITVCLDKDMKPTACDSNTYKRSSGCWDTEPIYYIG